MMQFKIVCFPAYRDADEYFKGKEIYDFNTFSMGHGKIYTSTLIYLHLIGHLLECISPSFFDILKKVLKSKTQIGATFFKMKYVWIHLEKFTGKRAGIFRKAINIK